MAGNGDGSVIIVIDGDDSGLKKELNGVGDIAKKAGKAAAAAISAIGVALSGMAVAAFNVGSDFESAFAGVKKTVDATDEQLAGLRDGIRDLAKELPQSASDIAAVAEAAGQLGIQTENILGFTEVMVQLGDATNLTSEEAATALARFANVTGLAQDKFGNLGSAIVALGNNMATTESEITSMAQRMAGAASNAGFTEAQILGLSAALSSVGVEAQAGGSAMSRTLNEIGIAVAKGGSEIAGFAKLAGMSSAEFARTWQEDAGKAFTAVIEGLNRVQKEGGNVALALEAVGITGTIDATALTNLAGASGLVAEAMGIATDAFEENTALANEAAQRYQTMESQMGMLGNTIKDIGISVYDEFREPMVTSLSAAKDAAGTLAKSMSGGEMKSALQTLAKGVGDVVKNASKFASEAIPKLVKGAATVVENFDKIAVAGAAAATSFVAFKTAIAFTVPVTEASKGAVAKLRLAWGSATTTLAGYSSAQAIANGVIAKNAIRAAALSGALNAQTIIVGTLTGRITLATAAHAALNAVMRASPAMLAATAITVLAGVISRPPYRRAA